MGILMWEKPAKAIPVLTADVARPGVYVPNMSHEDRLKWRAKLCGHKSGRPQVEIRTSKAHAELLVIVSMIGKIKYRGHDDRHPANVRISTNGPLLFTWDTWNELAIAIQEAITVLKEHDAKPAD